MTMRVASTIQRVDAIDAVGPQYWKSGNSPSAPVSSSCSAGGRT